MTHVAAAGGVVVVPHPFPGVVLVAHRTPPELRLPKGLVEPGESLEEAALREVLEETGVKAEIGVCLGDASWDYVYAGVPTTKTVTYFLMHHPVWEQTRPDPDIRGLLLVGLEVAPEIMTFDEERRIVETALTLNHSGA